MGYARECVCLCAHAARARRVPLPLTKPQWSSLGGHRALSHARSSEPRSAWTAEPSPSTTAAPFSPQAPSCPRGLGAGATVAPGKVLSSAVALGLGMFPSFSHKTRVRRPEIGGDVFRDPEQDLAVWAQLQVLTPSSVFLDSPIIICPVSRPWGLHSRDISPKETRKLGNRVSAEAVQ